MAAPKTISKGKTRKPWSKIKGKIEDKLPFQRKGNRPFLLTSMLPNIITLLSLCVGLSALRFAFSEQWAFAVVAIFAAAILDTMDGAVARMLNATSRFGAELDSLSDFAVFGVCPSLIMYFVSLKHFGSFGWVFVLWFSVCGALRLARFNTVSIEGTAPSWASGFFTGTPITSSAILCITPLMMHLAWPEQTLTIHPIFVAAVMGAVGFLMVSKVPTFSLKKIAITPKHMLPLIVGIVICATALISHPWETLSISMVIYVLTFILSYRAYTRLASKINKDEDQEPLPGM